MLFCHNQYRSFYPVVCLDFAPHCIFDHSVNWKLFVSDSGGMNFTKNVGSCPSCRHDSVAGWRRVYVCGGEVGVGVGRSYLFTQCALQRAEDLRSTSF